MESRNCAPKVSACRCRNVFMHGLGVPGRRWWSLGSALRSFLRLSVSIFMSRHLDSIIGDQKHLDHALYAFRHIHARNYRVHRLDSIIGHFEHLDYALYMFHHLDTIGYGAHHLDFFVGHREHLNPDLNTFWHVDASYVHPLFLTVSEVNSAWPLPCIYIFSLPSKNGFGRLAEIDRRRLGLDQKSTFFFFSVHTRTYKSLTCYSLRGVKAGCVTLKNLIEKTFILQNTIISSKENHMKRSRNNRWILNIKFKRKIIRKWLIWIVRERFSIDLNSNAVFQVNLMFKWVF